MKKRIGSEFKRMSELVQASDAPDEEKLMAEGCLNKLPALCQAFCESYESRDVDEILRLERGMLARLAEPTLASPKAQDLAKVLSGRLSKFHERLGLPQLSPSKRSPAILARPRTA